MLKVTALQCRRARGLLKWNHRDLYYKSGVSVHRLNSFERGIVHLRPDENKGLYDAFKEEGIVFQEYGEVILDTDKAGKKDKREIETQRMDQNFESEKINIDEEEYRRLTGLDALHGRGAQQDRRGGWRGKHTERTSA